MISVKRTSNQPLVINNNYRKGKVILCVVPMLLVFTSLPLYGQTDTKWPFIDSISVELFVPFEDCGLYGWKHYFNGVILQPRFDFSGFFKKRATEEGVKFVAPIVTNNGKNYYSYTDGIILPSGLSAVFDSTSFYSYSDKCSSKQAGLLLVQDENKYGLFSLEDKSLIVPAIYHDYDANLYREGVVQLIDSVSNQRFLFDDQSGGLKICSKPIQVYVRKDQADYVVVLESKDGKLSKFHNRRWMDWTPMDSILYHKAKERLGDVVRRSEERLGLVRQFVNQSLLGRKLSTILLDGTSQLLVDERRMYGGMPSSDTIQEGVFVSLNNGVFSIHNDQGRGFFRGELDSVSNFNYGTEFSIHLNGKVGIVEVANFIEPAEFLPIEYDRITKYHSLKLSSHVSTSIFMVEKNGKSYLMDGRQVAYLNKEKCD